MKVSFLYMRGNIRVVSTVARAAEVDIMIEKRKNNDIMIL